MITTIIASNSQDIATLQRIVSNARINSDIVSDTTQAVHALREHDMPIMLLSQEFDGSDALDQIHLFKQVNKRVKIILLADTDSVTYLRKARSAGIFYHALEPKTDEDMQELTMALESAREACEKQERSLLGKIARAIPTPG
jgi:DNA-binding NtrC family response regulator